MMRSGRILSETAIALLVLGVAAGPAMAQGSSTYELTPDPTSPWHSTDIRRFHDQDEVVWRGGHWFQGDHNGTPGWWWVVNDIWYLYPKPVYPAPNPLVPPVAAAPTGPDPHATYWYYCQIPAGYYPYLVTCPSGWNPVLAR